MINGFVATVDDIRKASALDLECCPKKVPPDTNNDMAVVRRAVAWRDRKDSMSDTTMERHEASFAIRGRLAILTRRVFFCG